MKAIRRNDFLKECLRGGVLAGLVGLGIVLGTREEKFECTNRCGKCVKFENGKCGLGLR